MNVLDLDVYMDVLYIMCAMCRAVLVILFLYKKIQHRLTYDGLAGPS
jgi:hypothetical protein